MSEETKQHVSPCSACPFHRKVTPGALGGSSPETYIGQANGNFWLPCHSTHDYRKLECRLDHSNSQCAGAAIFRSNVGVADRIAPQLLHLPADTEKVFGSFAEFYAHHKKISLEEANARLSIRTPYRLTAIEFLRSRGKLAKGEATLSIFPKE
jgi:hypothetical protein